jgi:hypothetical protein
MNNAVYQGWLERYKIVKAIKSPVQYDPNSKKRKPLAPGVFEQFIEEITAAMSRCDEYLDYYGYVMPKPLWQYNPDDPTTHPSSLYFAYGHLL